MIDKKFQTADPETSLQSLWIQVESLDRQFEDFKKKQNKINANQVKIIANTRKELKEMIKEEVKKLEPKPEPAYVDYNKKKSIFDWFKK